MLTLFNIVFIGHFCFGFTFLGLRITFRCISYVVQLHVLNTAEDFRKWQSVVFFSLFFNFSAVL